MSIYYANALLVNQIYDRNDNYLIDYSFKPKSGEKKICAIYFSSNGLYYPDNDDAFTEAIIKKNRYEWYGTRVKQACKHIFIRDVHKQWYLRGINSKIDTPYKLNDWLNKETLGYETITVGSSAGGYAAIQYGCLLNADRIYSFSPQVNLRCFVDNVNGKWPYVNELAGSNIERDFYDLNNVMKMSHNIFYFYPVKSSIDKLQYESIKCKELIHFIMIDSDKHGVPLSMLSLYTFLNYDKSQMFRYEGQIMNPKKINKLMFGWTYFFFASKLVMLKILRKYIFKYKNEL